MFPAPSHAIRPALPLLRCCPARHEGSVVFAASLPCTVCAHAGRTQIQLFAARGFVSMGCGVNVLLWVHPRL